MTVPQDLLRAAIGERYAKLASSCCSLSCGQALDIADVQPGEVFVDLGCGRGQDVIRAAGRVGAAGRAIGVDMNEAMLAKARASVPPFLANARFIHGDLAQFDIPDATVDVLISNCTVNHAPDKSAVYREIHRVLRPGGRFVVSDVVAEITLPEQVRADAEAWAGCYGGAITEAENVEAMRSAGFDAVQTMQRSDAYEKGGVLVRSITFKGVRA